MGKSKFEVYDGDVTVTYQDTPEIREKVIQRILQYCKDNNCSSGEQLHQNDECILSAPEVLSDIIDDIMLFEANHND